MAVAAIAFPFAVARGPRRDLDADNAARAAAIVDHELLAELLPGARYTCGP